MQIDIYYFNKRGKYKSESVFLILKLGNMDLNNLKKLFDWCITY